LNVCDITEDELLGTFFFLLIMAPPTVK
jgi:hypothetical protein